MRDPKKREFLIGLINGQMRSLWRCWRRWIQQL
jgi:hypothetical protein